jgi:hypothetical protein
MSGVFVALKLLRGHQNVLEHPDLREQSLPYKIA